MSSQQLIIHTRWVRIAHWFNALAVAILMMSGWRIYNATAFLGFAFPKDVTLGGWLGGALQWHFSAMWLLAGNGLLYIAMNLVSGRLARKFFPLSLPKLWTEFQAALRGELNHLDPLQYNTVQRLAYLFVMLDSVLLVLSGLVLWKTVQFAFLSELMGGYESARLVHFLAMTVLAIFVVIHLTMVALVPRTLIHITRGH